MQVYSRDIRVAQEISKTDGRLLYLVEFEARKVLSSDYVLAGAFVDVFVKGC